MDANVATRDADDSELDAAIESISALSGTTTPTNYDVDLSLLSKAPHRAVDRRADSRVSPKRHTRKPSQTLSESSLALPSSPPRETLNSDELDGPEDFTINMEYWMRCKLSDFGHSNAVEENATKELEADPTQDPTMESTVDTWVSRGSERLKMLAAERSAVEQSPQAKSDTLAEVSSTEQEQDASGSQPPRSNEDSDRPSSTVKEKIGEVAENPNLFQSAIKSSTPMLATVEDHFSSPARPGFSGAMGDNTTEDDREIHRDRIKGQASSSLRPGNDQLSFTPAVDRTTTLEAELGILRKELEQSRQETIEARNQNQLDEANKRSAAADMILELETANSTIRDLKTQLFSREHEVVQNVLATSPQVAPKQEQVTKSQLLDSGRLSSSNSIDEKAGATPQVQQLSQEPAEASLLHSHPASPQSARSFSSFVRNGSHADQKPMMLSDVSVTPLVADLDALTATWEGKFQDLQQRLEDTCKERAELIATFQEEKLKSADEASKSRETLTMQKADSEARIKFLREEVAQRSAELADAKIQLASAQRDAEGATDQLRIHNMELTREVTDLKARLEESGDTCRELRAKLTALQAQHEAQQHLHRMQERDRGRSEQLLAAQDVTPTQLEEVRRQAEDTVSAISRQLEREASSRLSLEREATELKDEVDLLKEQLRVSAFDGTNEDRRDSGISVEDSFQEQSIMSIRGEMQNLRNELREQIKVATDARAETKATKVEVEQLRRELRRLKMDQLQTNNAVDGRVEEAIRMREDDLKRRIKELKNEKRQMARALMRSWGELECGDNAPQKYRYAF